MRDIEPEVNLIPWLSLDGFNQVTETALEIWNKSVRDARLEWLKFSISALIINPPLI